MRFKVVIEYDRETKHYGGTVPGYPIFVDAKSERAALNMAKKAIQMYLEGEAKSPRRTNSRRERTRAKIVTVNV